MRRSREKKNGQGRTCLKMQNFETKTLCERVVESVFQSTDLKADL